MREQFYDEHIRYNVRSSNIFSSCNLDLQIYPDDRLTASTRCCLGLQIIFDFVGIENRGHHLSLQKYHPGLLSGRQESEVDILL